MRQSSLCLNIQIKIVIGKINDSVWPGLDLTLKSDSTTPNPAPAAALEHPPAVFVVSRTSGSMEGYIKVISDLRTAYVGRELNKAGILGTTSTLTDALRVRVIPDSNPHNIETLVSN